MLRSWYSRDMDTNKSSAEIPTITALTVLTPVEHTALTADTDTLRHVVRALDADLRAAMEAGVRGTQAHVGMLEMLHVFSREISLREVQI